MMGQWWDVSSFFVLKYRSNDGVVPIARYLGLIDVLSNTVGVIDLMSVKDDRNCRYHPIGLGDLRAFGLLRNLKKVSWVTSTHITNNILKLWL